MLNDEYTCVKFPYPYRISSRDDGCPGLVGWILFLLITFINYSIAQFYIVLFKYLMTRCEFDFLWLDFTPVFFLLFHDSGREYDKNGILQPWWKQESIDKFNESAQCFVNQYSAYTSYGEHVSLMLLEFVLDEPSDQCIKG